MSKRWQYKVVDLKPGFLGIKREQVEETLAALGQQGWELVTAIQSGLALRLYLKKEP